MLALPPAAQEIRLSKAPSKTTPASGQVRIIGGRWRGRRLRFPDRPDLRPTGDRLRETLFNWLTPRLPGARCLDLFAGSGALGIEAVSRGAASAVAVEKDAQVAAVLRQNCARLEAANITVVEADALVWLRRPPAGASFDIVFLDPPFAAGLLADAITLLAGGWLAPDAMIYVETPANQPLAAVAWPLHRSVATGRVTGRLFHVV